MSSKTLYIIWDDIIFDKDRLCFDSTRLKLILQPVQMKGLIKSLNIVKGEYFYRLFGKKAFKLTFVDGKLNKSLENSPGWARLLDAIELVQDYYSFYIAKVDRNLIRKNKQLNNSEVVDLYESIISKSEYLKYLAARLNADFRLIPILEYSNRHVEDSFLFRFRNKQNDILVIWENANEKRATYIFKYNEEKRPNQIQKIVEFIESTAYEQKRSLLSGSTRISKEIKRNLCFYKKYSHSDYGAFKAEIEYLLLYS